MPKKIISLNEAQKDQITESLVKDLPGIEKKVFDEIMTVIDTFNTDAGYFVQGVVSTDTLNQISTKINSILQREGYIQSVNTFMRDLGKITINTNTIMQLEGYSFQAVPVSEIEKKWANATAESLLNSGINDAFKTPILKIIDDSIQFGDSIATTRKTLEEFVMGGNDTSGKLSSYLTQTSRDAMSQMQGQQMHSIAAEIGWSGLSYVGGLLKDSRGQCTHWIRDLNGFIPKEKLQDEISMAYKNQKAKLITDNVHRWGGMMPNTTPDNFIIKRGGFNCTHSAIPKRKKNS